MKNSFQSPTIVAKCSIISFCCIFLLVATGVKTQAQTNPTPQNLNYSQSFGTSTFTIAPIGIATWTVENAPLGSQSAAQTSTPKGDATITADTTTQLTGGCYGYSTSSNGRFYIQTSSDTTNGTNQLVTAMVTTNLENIRVSYDVEMIAAQAKTIGVILQYRVGTVGSWANISESVYAHNNSTRSTGQIDNFIELNLPEIVNDENIVQLRWVTWCGSEVGNYSGIGIDNISIIGTNKFTQGPITTCSEELIIHPFSGVTAGATIVVSINLPLGVTAIDSASLSPDTNAVVVDTSDLYNPTYTFVAPATSFTLNYYVKADCETFAASNSTVYFNITDTINGVFNNTVTDTITINSPVIIFDAFSSTNLFYNNAFIDSNYTRTFVYENTGNNFTGELLFLDTIPNFYSAAIQFVSAVVDSVYSGTANIIDSIVNDSVVQLKISMNNFDGSLYLTETIKLIACPNGTNNHTYFSAFYGCANDTLCEEALSLVASTTTNEDINDKPILNYTLLTKGYPDCWKDAQERIIKINNTGLSAASEVQLWFLLNGSPWLTTYITQNSLDSFEIYHFDSLTNTKTPIPFLLDSVSISGYDYKTITTLEPLAAGDSLFFRYYELINCIDSTNYDDYFNNTIGMHYEGFPQVELIHPCNSTGLHYINEYSQNQYGWVTWEHPSNLQQTFYNYIGTMNGGDEADFEVSSSNLVVAGIYGTNTSGFIFNINNSEIQIELQLDSALGLVMDSIYLSAFVGGSPFTIYPDSIEYFLGLNPFIGGGDKIIAHFAIPDSFYVAATPVFPDTTYINGIKYLPTSYYNDFFSSFKVKFRLHAYCEYMSGAPSAIVQRFFFVPDKLCSPDCKLPLAKVEDAINVHCPGCLFPGWNISAFDIQRTNFDFADNNNNNFPDSFPLQPADTSLVQLKNVMVRDTLQFTLTANTSDGENALMFDNIGVDYQYAQLLLQNSRFGNLKFLGATGTFTDSNGVHSFTVPDYAGILDSNMFYLDLSIDSLKIYSGDTSLTQFWIGNDLTIKPTFAVVKNFTMPYFNIETITSFLFMAGTPFTGVMTKPDAFNYEIDTLAAMSDSMRSELSFWCTGYEGRYGAIGTDYQLTIPYPYVSHYESYTNNYHPCQNILRYDMRTEVGSTVLGDNDNNQEAWNSFSYELRNLWMLDSIHINYPNGYILDSVIFINFQLTSDGLGGNTGYTCLQWYETSWHDYDLVADAIIDNTSATIYPARNLTELTADTCAGPNSPNLRGWDESKRYRILFILKNTVCDTPLVYPTSGLYPVTTYWSNFPTATNGDTVIVQPLGIGEFNKPDAALTTNLNNLTQDAPNSDLMMNITVNTVQLPPISSTDSVTHSIAENTFLMIHSPSNNVVIDSIVDIPSNQRIYAINYLNNDSLYGLGNVGYFWGAANFNVFAHYNCANIDVSDSILIYTGWNCNGYPDSLQPLNTVCYLDSIWKPFNIIKPGLQASLSVPDTAAICDTLHYDVKLTATGTGSLDSVSVWMPTSSLYSFLSGSGQLVYSGTTTIVPTGVDTLLFALSDSNLLPNFEQGDTAHFLFDVITNCSFYTSVDKVKVFITATNYCGNRLDTIFLEKKPIYIELPEQDSLMVELLNDTISGCSETATVNITVTNVGNSVTGNLNTITVDLPTGFVWNSGNPFTSVNGQTYTFNLDSGMISGGTQTIQFGTADTVGNGVYNTIATIWLAQEIICGGDTCIFVQSLAAVTDTAQLTVINRDLLLDSSIVVAACLGSPTGSIDITVVGGTPPYTYSWVNSSAISYGTTEDLTNLIADTYIVTVTDSANCSFTDTFTVAVDSNCITNPDCNLPPTHTLPNGAMSSLSLIPNGSVVDVQGLFTINGTVTYTNVKFRMAAGARIDIISGNTLTLNKCHLFSCTQLWKEITVNANANLNVINFTIIEDAEKAIHWSNGGNVTLNSSIFNRNGAGLHLEGATTAPNVVMSNTIFTCRNFSTTFYQTPLNAVTFIALKNNLYNNNLGLYPYGSLIAPVAPNTRSLYGVISSQVAATIGITANAKNKNLFDYLDFGVHVTNANFTVINNYFANISGYDASTAVIGGMKGIGVYAKTKGAFSITIGGTNLLNRNLFKNCYRGANITDYRTINFINNILTNTTTSLTFIPPSYHIGHYGLAIFSTATNISSSLVLNYTITNNSVDNNSTGIYINSIYTQIPSHNIQLANNTLNVTGLGTYCNQGIWMQSLSGSSVVTGGVNVTGNTVKNSEMNALLFENVNDMLNVSGNNELSVKYNPNSKQVIRLNTCNGATVSDNGNIRTTNNTIIPTGSSNLITGIYLNNCQSSVVTCNTIKFVDVCVRFDQPNSLSQFRTNIMNKAQYGLMLANGAIIGQQGSATQPSGNEWGANNSTNITGFHTYTFLTPNANIASQLYCKPNANPNCAIGGLKTMPCSNWTDFPTQEYQLGTGLNTATGLSPSCALKMGNVLANAKALLHEADSGNSSVVTKFLQKRQAFQLIKTDTTGSLMADNELSTFYTLEQPQNLGKISTTSELISSNNFVTAQSTNNSITPTNVAEHNTKAVNKIWLQSLLDTNYVLTASDSSTLYTIGSICLQQGGDATVLARVLLANFTQSAMSFTDCVELPLGGAQNRTANNKMMDGNLILNGSFEYIDYDTTGVFPAIPWMVGNSPNIHTPSNELSMLNTGHQTPQHGLNFVGGYYFAWQPSANPNLREPIIAKTSITLTTGIQYCLSYYISLADTFNCGANRSDAYFSSTPIDPTLSSSPYLIYYPPHVMADTTIFYTDKLNWIRIEGSYIASGSENYITIGNLHLDGQTDTLCNGSMASIGFPNLRAAYYYMDNFSLEEIKPVNAGLDVTITIGDTIIIGNNADSASSYVWSPNYFIADTAAVNATVNPPVTTTYYVSKTQCSVTTTDTVTVVVNPVGVSEVVNENSVRIYPNPNNGSFRVAHNLLLDNNVYLEIMDLTGKIVHREILNTGNQQEIKTQLLSTGLYFVNFKTDLGELMYSTKMSILHE